MSPPPGARLTVDLGNSRCKLRLWAPSREELRGGLELEVAGDFLSVARRWLEGVERPLRAALSAVAEADLESGMAELLERVAGAGFLRRPDHGLELDCEQPETIGDDRLFAARAAVLRTGRTTIVVDCGTALTVDLVVRPDPAAGGARAVFAGGAIAPGPELLAAALSRGGARLPGVSPDPTVPALGKHTRAAIEAGIAVGLRGAARELVRGLTAESRGPAPPVVLTGGARAFLLAGEPLAAEVLVEPELVHLGLLAALGDGGQSA